MLHAPNVVFSWRSFIVNNNFFDKLPYNLRAFEVRG
jgi:hypothetical protein